MDLDLQKKVLSERETYLYLTLSGADVAEDQDKASPILVRGLLTHTFTTTRTHSLRRFLFPPRVMYSPWHNFSYESTVNHRDEFFDNHCHARESYCQTFKADMIAQWRAGSLGLVTNG